MSKNLGGWIHSFTVTDTVTHKNGYTIYKITSIVFPRSIPEALTCITVWKRFHEIKKLYRDLLKRHKTLQLRGKIPEPKNANNYFKRFDPEIINIRKSYILELLDFVGQHPALYKSNIFLNFFENGQTPNTSPNHNNNSNTDGINKYCNYLQQHEKQKKLKTESNIEAICDSLDLTYDNDINLIDPNKDKENDEENIITIEINKKQIEINDNTKELKNIPNNNNEELQQNDIEISLKNEKSNNNNNNSRLLISTVSFDGDNNDYIYEAALEFSQAVQSEVNQDYRIAYEKYKSGVDKLLTGSKDDSNDERKFIAKAKVTKYMNRAEELYEKYLLNTEDNKKTVQLSIDITDSTKELYLERPWNQLSKFKVIQIIDNVMQVQDITNKMLYIMKSIEKPSSTTSSSSSSLSYKKFSNFNSSNYDDDIRTIFLPQDVPYMVKLLGFFQSDIKIYLLLQQAKGGKLFDYIKNYKSIDHHVTTATSLSEIFTEIKNSNENTNYIKTIQDKENKQSQKQLIINYDSSFIALINEYKKSNNNNDDNNDIKKDNHFKNTNINKISNKTTANIFNNHKDDDDNDVNNSSNINDYKNYVPSFDILSEDMDVNDLVSCSQKLLKSVSNTLEQFKDTKIDNNDVNTLKYIENKVINVDNDNDNDSNQNNYSNNKINITEILPSSSLSSLSLDINDIKNKSNEIMEMHMSRHYVIPEVSIKQWARELVTAIDSLHQKGVILGDLRPDNLLLGSKGQLLLSYFYQNECTDNSNSRNYINFLATENLYVAPERPLTIKSDWWSFGVILFELLTGYAFKLCHPGNLSCYFDIQYPDDINISLTAKDLLSRTIQYNPEHRIGINEIKIHKFFDGTKWDDVINRGINSF